MRFFLSILLITGLVQANDLSKGMEALERGDFKSAVEFFKKAADNGDRIAQQNLVVMYNNGYGVKKDRQIASMWINRATVTSSSYQPYNVY